MCGARERGWLRGALAARRPGELLIGWTAHYVIGISFALLLLSTFGL